MVHKQLVGLFITMAMGLLSIIPLLEPCSSFTGLNNFELALYVDFYLYVVKFFKKKAKEKTP